ncbi:hypothetical protein D9M68_931510 [compost metagenome]
MGLEHRDAVYRHLHMSRKQIRNSLPCSTVGNVDDIDTRRLLEKLTGEMAARTRPGAGVVDLSGPGFRILDQILD